ncbi:MAG: RodZ domain-containing protein [Candidatus Aminicenantales bacterium]
MASLGQELKKQRESRNISIDEMASSTKIVGRYLEALEQDRFDAMPGGFFVKGILGTYARYVGLDETEIFEKYREAGVLEEEARTKAPAARPLPDAGGKRKIMPWVIAGVSVLVVIAVFSVLSRSRRPRITRHAPQPAATLPQARTKTTPPVEKPAPAPVKAEWKGLTMDISFQEQTWLQIYADGALKIYGLFPPGEKAQVQAEKEILVAVVGNAGGMTFLLNGQPGKVLGRTGEVLNNVRINVDNIKDFLRGKDSPGPSD